MSAIESIQLTDTVAKVAGGSIILCAVLIAGAAFKMAATTPVKIVAVVIFAALAAWSFWLFTANEKHDPAARQRVARCQTLLADLKRGIADKLVHETQLSAAKNIARSLLADIRSSSCSKPLPG